MKNKIINLILVAILIVLPFFASADGGVFRPMPNGDMSLVKEKSQQAFINYENGVEKLIIAADIEEGSYDIFWIIPIPANPENIKIDISPELPIFYGDEVMSKAKINFSENLKNSYYASLFGQIWTLPFSIPFISLGDGARSGGGRVASSGDLVSIENHIEKLGMASEVVSAKNGQAIYNYFIQKGFNIKQGNIAQLNSYIEKDYSFVVSWISGDVDSKENKRQRGIFISFPVSKIYYPLTLTSIYGETKIPITIRTLDHIKPETFKEIKPYTEVSYFIERTKTIGAKATYCKSNISQIRNDIEMYYDDHNNSYPSSFQELLNDKLYGNSAREMAEDINRMCGSPILYFSKGKDHFAIRITLASGAYELSSSSEKIINETNYVSSELQEFYGDKKPWLGEAEYTKIFIDAPAKLFKQDLWMKKGSLPQVSLALWTINNPLIIMVILYLLIVVIFSLIAGGIAGWICYRKFKKYAVIGLGNIASLLGLILLYKYVKKKTGADNKYSKSSFISFFTIIFVFLLLFLLLLATFL